jgi:hypothetical protein
MGKLIGSAALVTSVLFLALTAWSVTVTGLLEPARFDVSHFDAGAGDELLLVRGALALGTTVLLIPLAFLLRDRRSRWSVAALIPLVLPVFVWSCVGIERWALGYSERAFDTVLDRYLAKRTVTVDEVVANLGPPLFTAPQRSGETVWSYSYMPSGGLGWHKRILWVQGGAVTYMYTLDEP